MRTWFLGVGSAVLAAGCGNPAGPAATAPPAAAVADPTARAAEPAADPLDRFAAADAAGKTAVLELLPQLLNQNADPERCRAVVRAGLALPGVDARQAAVRAAMHPAVGLRAAVLPLLAAPEPEVRRAALFAVGPAAADAPVIGDEDLFRWLHDPDAGVRQVCREALVSRGRSDGEIALGRRLTHPDAGERLRLLLDLRDADDVADPEPWLERLGRDPDPGVRAGAARVMVEVAAERRSAPPAWVGRLAEGDPDPTVRRVVGVYAGRPGVATDRAVRPAGGP